jgi:hypothetical protein
MRFPTLASASSFRGVEVFRVDRGKIGRLHRCFDALLYVQRGGARSFDDDLRSRE